MTLQRSQMRAEARKGHPGGLALERGPDSSVVIRLSGPWRMHHGLPSASAVERELEQTKTARVTFEASGVEGWDSSLLTFVTKAADLCKSRNIATDFSGLPAGLTRLIELAEAVPEKMDARAKTEDEDLVHSVGTSTLNYVEATINFLTFLGEVIAGFGRLFTGRARFRRIDLLMDIQDAGVRAFGIVTLISFLVGTILAFMGAVQLSQFGAAIYVADAVAIGMVREMGAMMTAIIMAGRTGAAYAAQLGTMKVTQEIDALTTMGLSPIDFLVLPRVIALVLMMPLLCIYADLMGILGGAAVGTSMLGLSFGVYMRESYHAIYLGSAIGGLFKATSYGVIIAVAGCLRGFECGNSSSAVGDAATSAVVTGIVYIVVACGLFAWLFNLLGI